MDVSFTPIAATVRGSGMREELSDQRSRSSIESAGRMNETRTGIFFHSMTTEAPLGLTFERQCPQSELRSYIQFYNQERLHSAP